MACMRATVATPSVSTDDNRVGRSRTDFACPIHAVILALMPHRAIARTSITFHESYLGNFYAEVCSVNGPQLFAQIDVG